MADRHSKSKARRRRSSSASNRRSASAKELRAKIEAQRRQLSRASSVLGCAAIAFDGDGCLTPDVDYVDAMQAARSLIGDVIEALDSVNLCSRPPDE
jgi:hypothetical protein